MADYPFDSATMLYRLTFYFGSTMALFGVFFLWRRSGWNGQGWKRLFEILNIGGYSVIFIALWFLCGISSMKIDEIRPAIGPLVFGGFFLILLSFLIYFKKVNGSLMKRPPSTPQPTGSPEDR
jgi:hypothetical protein